MNNVLQKTTAALERYADKKLAIGVSGGRDSVCLLHAVINCGLLEKKQITVVHVNHCLRKEADRDENFVRRLCAEYAVDFRAFRVNVKQTAAKNGSTIEQAARNLRYAVFYELVSSGVADIVLTAHHALDNAETVLMHLFRGAGIDGLRGMANDAVKPLNTINSTYAHTLKNIKTIRPFIEVYPNELDEYVKENKLEYVVDSTNFVDDADRNFIRLNVIPLIEQRYSGAVRAVNAFAKDCAAACSALDGMLDRSLIVRDRGAVIVKNAALGGPLAARYIRHALAYFTTVDITREQIERTAALYGSRTGAVIELTGGIRAAREYAGVALYILRAECEQSIPIEVGGNYIDGLAVDIESNAEDINVKGGAVDLDKLDGAVFRFRRDGDYFTPFGGVRKKLNRYFIDNKIEKRVRDRIPLICRGDEVLVVVGYQIADSVKLTENTVNKAVVKQRW
ncbi:MAG: tRNA lysidine(34) synthetase TilS [Clostridiales bacterium]|nr:tRNA lysidine(34) synthetase TilS [Clostridiales bacterium]